MLLKSSPEEVKKLIETYEKDVSGIKRSALSLSWHMRGGASYEDVLNMSSEEREHINSLIEEHIDITKKSQLPYF
jgi:hypothetical protein